MPIKKIALAALAAGLVLASATLSFAQDATSQTPATAQASPDSQQQAEEKAKLERKATVLLEQVISEAQALKLPENRIRVQIAAGDMLWDHNPGRARDQFTNAGAAISQMNLDADRTDRDEMQNLNQLRQDLVLTAAHWAGQARPNEVTVRNFGGPSAAAPPCPTLRSCILRLLANGCSSLELARANCVGRDRGF